MAINRRKRARQHDRQRLLTHKRRRIARMRRPATIKKATASRRTGQLVRGKYGAIRNRLPVMMAMPNQVRVKLKYVEGITATNIGGVAGSQTTLFTFQNSMFDPNAATGGHQPKEYDFWQSIYKRYNVSRIDMKVELFTHAESGVAHGHVYVDYLEPGGALTTVGIAVMEATRFKRRQVVWTADSAGGRKTTIFQSFFPNRILQNQAVDAFWTAVGADPAPDSTVDFVLRYVNSSADSQTSLAPVISGMMTLTYHATMNDKVTPNAD